jgi:hypothetical protein
MINRNGSRQEIYGEATDENRRCKRYRAEYYNIPYSVFSFHDHKTTEVSDRGPDHGNRKLVYLVTKSRSFTVLHCIGKIL